MQRLRDKPFWIWELSNTNENDDQEDEDAGYEYYEAEGEEETSASDNDEEGGDRGYQKATIIVMKVMIAIKSLHSVTIQILNPEDYDG